MNEETVNERIGQVARYCAQCGRPINIGNLEINREQYEILSESMPVPNNYGYFWIPYQKEVPEFVRTSEFWKNFFEKTKEFAERKKEGRIFCIAEFEREDQSLRELISGYEKYKGIVLKVISDGSIIEKIVIKESGLLGGIAAIDTKPLILRLQYIDAGNKVKVYTRRNSSFVLPEAVLLFNKDYRIYFRRE